MTQRTHEYYTNPVGVSEMSPLRQPLHTINTRREKTIQRSEELVGSEVRREMVEELADDDESWMGLCVSVDMTIETMPFVPFEHSSRYNSFILALTLTYQFSMPQRTHDCYTNPVGVCEMSPRRQPLYMINTRREKMIERSEDLVRSEMLEELVRNADYVERWMDLCVADNMSLETRPYDRYDTRRENRIEMGEELVRRENKIEMGEELVRRENRIERSVELVRSDVRRVMVEDLVRNADNDERWMEWRRMIRDRSPPPLQSPGELHSNTVSLQYRPDLSKPRYNSLPYPPR